MAAAQVQVIDPALLDDIINRLLEVRSARPGKQVQLSEAEIRQLCVVSREIFLQQPNLLELEAPIKICGRNIRFWRKLDGIKCKADSGFYFAEVLEDYEHGRSWLYRRWKRKNFVVNKGLW